MKFWGFVFFRFWYETAAVVEDGAKHNLALMLLEGEISILTFIKHQNCI
jgi:hypothetical protein